MKVLRQRCCPNFQSYFLQAGVIFTGGHFFDEVLRKIQDVVYRTTVRLWHQSSAVLASAVENRIHELRQNFGNKRL